MALTRTDVQDTGDPRPQRSIVSSVPAWDPTNVERDPSSQAGSYIDWGALNFQAWSKIVIAGKLIPCIAQVESDKETRLQQNQTPGPGGANTATLGTSPGRVTIRMRFANEDDLAAWVGVLRELQPAPGKPNTKPVGIEHPGLGTVGITALILESVSVPKVESPGGFMLVTTRWLEHLPIGHGKSGILGSANMGPLPKSPNAKPKTKPSEKP